MALTRTVALAAAATLLAGCGATRSATHATTTAGRTTTAATHAKSAGLALARNDLRFLRLLVDYDREDAVGATLAARKAASPQLHASAVREAREASSEVTAATALLRRAHFAAGPAPTALAQAWATAYQTLLANAGSPFDAVYAPLRERRAAEEAALAHHELATRGSEAAKGIAREVARARAADLRALRAA